MKTLDESFRDWEADVFGFGYGSGEPHTLGALKTFLAAIPERPYNYEVLERACGAQVAWLLINTLCHAHMIEYGTSPRFGWLTPRGEGLKRYVDARSLEELLEVVSCDEEYVHCYPKTCNCGAEGYEVGRVCPNPFWGTSPFPAR